MPDVPSDWWGCLVPPHLGRWAGEFHQLFLSDPPEVPPVIQETQDTLPLCRELCSCEGSSGCGQGMSKADCGARPGGRTYQPELPLPLQGSSQPFTPAPAPEPGILPVPGSPQDSVMRASLAPLFRWEA